MDTIFDSGVTLILLLQTLGTNFISLMKGFTFLGNEEFYLLIFPLLYWCIDHTLGLRTGIMLMISGILNSYFKWMLHLPRPYWCGLSLRKHLLGRPRGILKMQWRSGV